MHHCGESLVNCPEGGPIAQRAAKENRQLRPPHGYDSPMTHLRPTVLFGIVASMACGIMLGVMAFWKLTDFADKTRDEHMLLSVLREVGESYIDEVPRSELIDNAIRGVVDGLDDHSGYLDARALAIMEEETRGHFGGIGVELDLVDGYFTVVSPIDGAPAANAGILAGDRLVEVDHRSLKGQSWRETVGWLRGKPGTDVHVRIRRAADLSLDFDLTRDTINVPSAHGRSLVAGLGYVRISQFNDTTAGDLAKVVNGLRRSSSLTGLVIDLRNNPGGLLNAAVDVADAFLAEGVIVATDGRLADSERTYEAGPGDLIDGRPLAVLINSGSASASEIVAAALQDHDRATVLGTRSYGKGSVQSVMYIRSQRAIKLTTARYLTPSGHSLQSNGVVPDVAVPKLDGESGPDYDERLIAAAIAALGDRDA